MLPYNLHAVETGLWLFNGKLQADHHHLTVSLSVSIHTLNPKLHKTKDQNIGDILNMQSL